MSIRNQNKGRKLKPLKQSRRNKQRGRQLLQETILKLIKEKEELNLRLEASQKAADEALRRAKAENNRLEALLTEVFNSIDVIETTHEVPMHAYKLLFPPSSFETHMNDEASVAKTEAMKIAKSMKECTALEILGHLERNNYISWTPEIDTRPYILREWGKATARAHVINPEKYRKMREVFYR